MFRADFGRWPTREELLDSNDRGFIYLRSWPEYAQAPAANAAQTGAQKRESNVRVEERRQCRRRKG